MILNIYLNDLVINTSVFFHMGNIGSFLPETDTDQYILKKNIRHLSMNRKCIKNSSSKWKRNTWGIW